MAKRGKQTQMESFTELKQFTSVEEIDRALQKLQNRLFEVRRLKSDNVHYDDQKVENVEQSIRISILEIFGPNSPEFGAYRHHTIFQPTLIMGLSEPERQALHWQNQARFIEQIPQTEELLNGLINRLYEKRNELAMLPASQTRVAFQNLSLPSAIASACSGTYLSGHYREAVLNASIALVDAVKQKSGRYDLDGSRLMSTVFAPNRPALAFNELSNQTERDEQEGMMHLFMGAVLALRNPRAHALFDDSPEMALDYIAFLSMLAKRLDTTKRV